MHDEMPSAIQTLESAIAQASSAIDSESEAAPEQGQALKDLAVRAKKLANAWGRPQCLGFFGPSQAGKSFLVGALLSHELGSLSVTARTRELDFLKEINPAKGVESTGVVTRFTTQPAKVPLTRGDFRCQLLSLELVLESLATGFLVECTSPAVDPERVERCLRDARLQAGPAAPPMYLEAWEDVWHDLNKKYQDRHPYLNDLRRQASLRDDAWKREVKTIGGWLLVYSLLWGGPGHANDLDAILRLLVQGLDAVGHARTVEVGLEHVRASSEGASVIDASCLNSLGTGKTPVRVFAQDTFSNPASGAPGREVAVEPGILSALIAEIRLELKRVEGSLLDKVDILDFPGGRALKGINGFGRAELNTGKLENAVEVYKRGKLTFLFEQFSIDREITALCLCSPGPTKPEAVQLQSQVEQWIKTRYGAASPTLPQEVEDPSLFLALTKYDMSLGALRSDNAKDRWDSRVQEACVDFWARSANSWLTNWGTRGQPFNNMFWIRNPYADQMQSLKPGQSDYEVIKQGYLQSRAVQRHVKAFEEKWRAVEGDDERTNLPKSGVPLLAQSMRTKLADDVKAKELRAEAAAIRAELITLLRAMTPSKDAAEERARILESAQQLVNAVSKEMTRRCSGAVFGELFQLITPSEQVIEQEVRKAYGVVAPMSIKTSDKVKKVLVHILKWWVSEGVARVRGSELQIPPSLVDVFVREVCTSKLLLPVLGNAVYPYFSRNILDTGIVATILQVKISDAMVTLFSENERQTPQIPARLSYSEAVGGAAGALEGGQIDWSDVSFEDAPASKAEALGVELVFAGSRAYKRWGASLGDFYLKSRGGQAKVAPDDPRVVRLVSVLKEVENVHVPAG